MSSGRRQRVFRSPSGNEAINGSDALDPDRVAWGVPIRHNESENRSMSRNQQAERQPMPDLASDPDMLRSAVAAHYDDLDRFYREIWGEHVHHGLWTSAPTTPAEAARCLIDVVAGLAQIEAGDAV